MLLDKIEKANDIKKIDKSDYGELAEEIRQFLIQKDIPVIFQKHITAVAARTSDLYFYI